MPWSARSRAAEPIPQHPVTARRFLYLIQYPLKIRIVLQHCQSQDKHCPGVFVHQISQQLQIPVFPGNAPLTGQKDIVLLPDVMIVLTERQNHHLGCVCSKVPVRHPGIRFGNVTQLIVYGFHTDLSVMIIPRMIQQGNATLGNVVDLCFQQPGSLHGERIPGVVRCTIAFCGRICLSHCLISLADCSGTDAVSVAFDPPLGQGGELAGTSPLCQFKPQ